MNWSPRAWLTLPVAGIAVWATGCGERDLGPASEPWSPPRKVAANSDDSAALHSAGPFRLPPIAVSELPVARLAAIPDPQETQAYSQPLVDWYPDDAPIVPAEVVPPSSAFPRHDYDDDAADAASVSPDELTSYWPAATAMSGEHTAEVRAAFALARSGALHAAERKFVAVLESVARTSDTADTSTAHIRDLGAALTALDEADDFLAATSASGADHHTVAAIAAVHRTPVLTEIDIDHLLPHEAIALYHRYAERKLMSAVGTDPAASMALFGLGKVYAHMATRDDDAPQAMRRSVTMYRAAVMVRDDNPLASNELGVALARAGRYQQAHPYLARAVQLAPTANHHHNLAVDVRNLGDHAQASELEATAISLAQRDMARGQLSAGHGITWVSPQDFNRTSEAAPQVPPVPQVTTQPMAAAPPQVGPLTRSLQKLTGRTSTVSSAAAGTSISGPQVARQPGTMTTPQYR